MARTARKHSDTGVYHAILRGVNKQQVFEDEEVYERFLNVLRGQTLSDVDVQGQTVPPRYHVYTYCQMGNHVNLLLKEGIGPRTLSRLTDVPYSIAQMATSVENEKRSIPEWYANQPRKTKNGIPTALLMNSSHTRSTKFS